MLESHELMSTASAKRVFAIYVSTQFSNLGDALINRELIRLLASHGEVLVGTAAAPTRFREVVTQAAPPSVRHTSSWLTFSTQFLGLLLSSALGRKRLCLVMNPGGYGGEHTRPAGAKSAAKAAALGLLKRVGMQAALIGVSYESIGPRRLRSLRRLASRLDLHLVRDSGSKLFCSDTGVWAEGPIPDLAFNLTASPSSPAIPPSAVAISLRSMGTGLDRFVARTAQWAQTNGFRVTFSSQVRGDDAFQEQLAMSTREPVQPRILESIDEALDFYANQTIVVSNRLHVLLLAWRAGAIPIAVVLPGKNEKVRRLFRDVGLQGHVIELSELGEPSELDFLRHTRRRADLAELFEAQREILQRCIEDSLGRVS